MLLAIGLLSGLVLLFFGGNWLVQGASRLAESAGVSPLVVGLTIVAIGTSAPELIVSISAALSGSADIAVGNVVGSNIANIGLILGLSALIYPVSVHVTMLRREIPIMLFVTLLAVWMFNDNTLTRGEGGVLLIGLVLFTAFMLVASRQEQQTDEDLSSDQPVPVGRLKEGMRTLVGMLLLVIGAQLTVSNATELARNVGVSEVVIGITLVALGTSLPELVTSITAAWRKQSDIAIGNVVGSNIFNILGILGVSALLQPIEIVQQVATVDALVMLGFSVLLLPFVLDRILGRIEGLGFLLGYVGFTLYAIS
ncbi:MAG: calcium/sodium antiporter [Chloroflexota bacterium]